MEALLGLAPLWLFFRLAFPLMLLGLMAYWCYRWYEDRRATQARDEAPEVWAPEDWPEAPPVTIERVERDARPPSRPPR